MRTLIVDDEAPARLELRRLLSLHPEVILVGEAANIRSALEQTEEHRPDLVFLDVHLRGESGFDYIAGLPEHRPAPRIIFLTAHDRYAIRAFECNALDYLLKPVAPDRLANSLTRLAPSVSPPAEVMEDDMAFIKAGSSARLVPWADIHAITADGNYTHVHLAGGERLIVLRPLKEWLPLAPAGRFIQVHRSAIVQQRVIAEVRTLGEKKRRLTLICKREIPVGREYFGALNRLVHGEER